MKLLSTFIMSTALLTGTTGAASLTPCTGSWDGVGLTACELLGGPGRVGGAYGTTFTAFGPIVLWEITAYDATNRLTLEADGSLSYQPREAVPLVFHSNDPLSTRQFAVWFRGDDEIIVGIEDLTDGDFDFNDHVVSLRPQPVPEPALVGMVVLGLIMARRRRRAA